MIGVILCGGRGTRLNKNKKNKILKGIIHIHLLLKDGIK